MAGSFVRGSLVTISVSFFDKDGVALTPPGATLRLTYMRNGAQVDVDNLAMTVSGPKFIYDWDSSVADHGTVYWSARTASGEKARTENSFTLTANPANPAT